MQINIMFANITLRSAPVARASSGGTMPWMRQNRVNFPESLTPISPTDAPAEVNMDVLQRPEFIFSEG